MRTKQGYKLNIKRIVRLTYTREYKMSLGLCSNVDLVIDIYYV